MNQTNWTNPKLYEEGLIDITFTLEMISGGCEEELVS